MDEKLKKELAVISAYEKKYGTDEFEVMDALMEKHGYYGNWSVEVIGDGWDEIDKIAQTILEKINEYIEQ